MLPLHHNRVNQAGDRNCSLLLRSSTYNLLLTRQLLFHVELHQRLVAEIVNHRNTPDRTRTCRKPVLSGSCLPIASQGLDLMGATGVEPVST